MRKQDSDPVRVLIVSDSPIIRSGLRKILESQTTIRVLGDMSFERAGANDSMLHEHPDLVLFDLDPRGNEILTAIGNIQKILKDSFILVLSDLADHELARKAMSFGASGLVLKIQPPSVLIAAIHELCPRYTYQEMPKSLMADTTKSKIQKLLKPRIPNSKDVSKIETLTSREREIIGLIGLGLKNKDIANRLSISDITVRHHLTSIFCKLEVADRQKLLIVAHQYGLADLTLSAEPA